MVFDDWLFVLVILFLGCFFDLINLELIGFVIVEKIIGVVCVVLVKFWVEGVVIVRMILLDFVSCWEIVLRFCCFFCVFCKLILIFFFLI